MGRIKTQLIKRITQEFIRKYGNQLSSSFDENKAVVDKHLSNSSKKIRNVIAGYATRITRRNTGG